MSDEKKSESEFGETLPGKRVLKLSKLRRYVMFSMISLFMLQFVKVKALVGGLSGSLLVWNFNLIDVFAYAESLVASREFTIHALLAVLPIAAIYLVFGRAFCGWVCPMDFLYEKIDRARGSFKGWGGNVPPKAGYAVLALLLTGTGLLQVPLFTNYFSHLTNFFRALTGGLFIALDLPVDKTAVLYSAFFIIMLLALEFFFPRLWCRVLCPVGKTYGFFNKVSLLRLKFSEGECGECNLCDNMCYMQVKIARNVDQAGLRDVNCIYCGNCIEGCSTKGKLITMKLWR